MINTILLLGSSTIKKWKDFTMNLQNEYIINKGISSLTTSYLLTNEYMEYVCKNIEIQPKYIVIYCGINDVFDNVENKQIVNNIQLFLNELHTMFTKSKIIVISLIKSPKVYKEKKLEDVNYINNKIREYCTTMSKKISYVNVNKELYTSNGMYFTKDNFHVNELGYKKINKKILQNK
jgi:lysophospholipase L1-like esterase